MREYKFKAWLPGISKMTYAHTLEELMNWDTKKEDNGTAIWLQWTGFTDGNGKDVYVGDIVFVEEDDYEEAIKGIVTWDKECGYYFLDRVWEEGYTGDRLFVGSYAVCGEVIGNIYENADMLPKATETNEYAK